MFFVYLFGFVIIMLLLLFGLMIATIKMREREETNPLFHEKMERFRKISNPVWNVGSNLFWWVIALLLLYFIIMSGSNY